jgi:hypothetical protein
MITTFWSAISRTSATVAVVMGFLARRAERMAARYRAAHSRLERITRWTHAKAMRIPLGVDLAGEEWEEPTLLPEAPTTPPPIPPAAFFTNRPSPKEDAEWGAAIIAAKQDEPPPPSDEWAAALEAAKRGNTPVPVQKEQPRSIAATAPAKPATTTVVPPPSRELRAVVERPAPRPAERRIGPKPLAAPARAVEPRITMKGSPAFTTAASTPKPVHATVDPHVAAATRQAIKAALRT